MAKTSSLLSLCPVIKKRGDVLIATAGRLWSIISLGFWHRQLIVDPDQRSLTIRRGGGMFRRRRRRIPFEIVSAIVYGYDDLSMKDWQSATHDSVDQFSVGLRLCDDEYVPLFSFLGEGTFTNEGVLPDWWYWQDFHYDMSGTQEKESRAFVEVLSQMLKVPVEAPPA